MDSDQNCDIAELVCATERNISRITAVSGKFAVPCLNEWRYATKHVAYLLKDPNDAVQREKAIGHLKRAYFDSSDILLTVLVASLREVFDDVGEYVEVAASVIPGFATWSSVCTEALRLQRDPCEDRYSRAVEMDKVSADLIGFLGQANISRGNLLAAIARKRRNERLGVVGVMAAVASAICALIAFFL